MKRENARDRLFNLDCVAAERRGYFFSFFRSRGVREGIFLYSCICRGAMRERCSLAVGWRF